MRALFGDFELTDFEIAEIEHSAPVISIVRGTATVNGRGGTFECRWIRQTDDGGSAFGNKSGEWRLVFCSPSVWTRD